VYFSGGCQAIGSATGSACITWKNRNRRAARAPRRA
jgi:hypothetical protein